MQTTPQPFGEILNQGMVMFGRVWKKVLVPAFWAFLLLGGATIAVFSATGAGETLQMIVADPLVLDGMSESEVTAVALELLQAGLIVVAIQLVAGGFVNLAVHLIVAAEITGQPIGAGEASTGALRRLPSLLAAGLVALLAIILGLLALIIPGLWLIGSFTMVSAVVALEEAGPMAALRRSMSLVRGRWWPTVGFLVLVGLLGSVAAQLVQLVALPIISAAGVGLAAGLGFVILMVAQGLVVAAIAVMVTLWYFDLRARQEPLVISTPR
jgi:hypothetical protein